MRHSCELIVLDILPIIRKELALELIKTHKIRKSVIARMFNVSGTAISQYVHGSRGNRDLLNVCPMRGDLMKEIKRSAKRLADKKTEMIDELCHLCTFVKTAGIAEFVYGELEGGSPMIGCLECPRPDPSDCS
jgi:predicted transcriptional regulator